MELTEDSVPCWLTTLTVATGVLPQEQDEAQNIPHVTANFKLTS